MVFIHSANFKLDVVLINKCWQKYTDIRFTYKGVTVNKSHVYNVSVDYQEFP